MSFFQLNVASGGGFTVPLKVKSKLWREFLKFHNYLPSCEKKKAEAEAMCLLKRTVSAFSDGSTCSLISVLQSQQQSNLLSHDEQGNAPADLSTYLELDCIIGSTDKHGELQFLVKW